MKNDTPRRSQPRAEGITRRMPRPNDGPGDECTYGSALGCAPPAFQAADRVRILTAQVSSSRAVPGHAPRACGRRPCRAHAAHDLFMRQGFDVPQQDDLSVIGRQPAQGLGQASSSSSLPACSLGEEPGAARASPSRRDDSAIAASSDSSRPRSRRGTP